MEELRVKSVILKQKTISWIQEINQLLLLLLVVFVLLLSHYFYYC